MLIKTSVQQTEQYLEWVYETWFSVHTWYCTVCSVCQCVAVSFNVWLCVATVLVKVLMNVVHCEMGPFQCVVCVVVDGCS